MAIEFTLNGKPVSVDVPSDALLLWVLREDFRLTGTKYGCGRGQCGSCTVHIDGQARFSCRSPMSAIEGKSVTTIEGLSPDGSHPLQKAWISGQVPQCGYCQSGQIMRAAALLQENSSPTHEEIVTHMDPVLCRCGTYNRILRAIESVIEQG
ncbi:MAG: (2Fe-2S)-binding protein [Bacteroidetes bacterium]|nr:(2Fe-2S)-binding protein [Bacteroidota bacterium]MCH8246818.1 (2Fe-2S)-binding protein [Bacteroidota bacterium]